MGSPANLVECASASWNKGVLEASHVGPLTSFWRFLISTAQVTTAGLLMV
jgi:hypothetical protein